MAKRSSRREAHRGAIVSEILLGKFFMEDDLDGKYSTGEIIDFLFEKYALVRYDAPGDRPGPFALISLEEMSSFNPNGAHRYHLFESREALKDYLTAVDGDAQVLKLVRSSAMTKLSKESVNYGPGTPSPRRRILLDVSDRRRRLHARQRLAPWSMYLG